MSPNEVLASDVCLAWSIALVKLALSVEKVVRPIGVLESLAWNTAMPFIDTTALEVIERLPGWYGRYFHSPNMTFTHYDFKRGSSIHEHFHPQEEVYEVIEGELELTIDGVTQVARQGLVGIVPSNVRHSVKALSDGRAIIVDYPLRREMGERRS